jgi:hypothetical protein
MDPTTLERELASLPREHLLSLNVDLNRIVTTVYTALPRLQRLRPELAQMPGLDPGLLDKLPLYVDALVAAHAGGAEAAPADPRRALVPEARAARERLTTAVDALVLREIVSASSFKNVSNGKGYRNLANDLRLLSAGLRTVWPRIQGRSPVTREELSAAEALATQLLDDEGQLQAEPPLRAAQERCSRIFTLVLRSYDELRGALAWLRRRQGDANTIAPSLYPRGKQARAR